MREKIATTEARAKEIKPLIDRLINQSKKLRENKATAIRELGKKLPAQAAKKISGEFRISSKEEVADTPESLKWLLGKVTEPRWR